MRALPVLFILFPLIELYLLLEVGAWLGALVAFGLVIGTALLGVQLLRRQGAGTWQKAATKWQTGEVPSFEILSGLIIVVSAVLMILPGLISDTLGFLGLLPFSRKWILTSSVSKVNEGFFRVYQASPMRSQPSSANTGAPRTIEGEFKDLEK